MLPLALLTSALLALQSPADGELVTDLHLGPAFAKSSFPVGLGSVGDHAYFRATSPVGSSGTELWRTDGTVAGTTLAADLIPGPPSSSPRAIAQAPGGRLCVRAGLGGDRLWSVDPATGAATELFAGPGAAPFDGLGALAYWGGSTWFLALQGGSELGLWRTDGTQAGTLLDALLDPAFQPATPDALRLSATPGRLFAHASNRLWVKSTSSGPAQLAVADKLDNSDLVVASRVFFRRDAGSGAEPWVTDGTPAGTVALGDLFPGAAGSDPGFLSDGGGFAWFTAETPGEGRELWRSNGTPGGTALVADLDPGPADSFDSFFPSGDPQALRMAAWFQGKLWFVASGAGAWYELYTSDGSAAGTAEFFAPGGANPAVQPNSIDDIFALGGQLGFVARTGGAAHYLWTSDGSPAGTRVRSGSPEIEPDWSPVIWNHSTRGAQVLYRGEPSTPTWIQPDREPWVASESTTGTQLLADLWPEPLNGDAEPAEFGKLPGKLFFNAYVLDVGREPMIYDHETGQAEVLLDVDPTVLPINIPNSSDPAVLGSLGGRLIFAARDTSKGREPWITDGTAAGTQRLADLNSPLGSSDPGTQHYTPNVYPVFDLYKPHRDYVEWSGRGFFTATIRTGAAQDFGRELVVTDGTEAGTQMLVDLNPGAADADPRDLTLFQGQLWFLAAVPGAELALCRTDGTAAGTAVVFQFGSSGEDPDALTRHLLAIGDRLLIRASSPAAGFELWSSDGTPAGTQQIADLDPGPASSSPEGLVRVGDRGVFFATVGGERQVWSSDGTAAGTLRLSPPGPTVLHFGAGAVPLLASDGARAWFVAIDEGVYRLVTTAGTPASTAAIDPGVDWFNLRFPRETVTPTSGGLFFMATTADAGEEIWFSDGSSAGTFRFSETEASGEALSTPAPYIARVGNSLLYTATGDYGSELYHAAPFVGSGAHDVSAYGSGACSASGQFDLGLSGQAAVGELVRFELSGASPMQNARLFGSARPAAFPLSPGCSVYLDAPYLELFTLPVDGLGAGALDFAIQNSNLLGVPIHLQALVVLPGSFELSNGLEVLIGQ